MTESFAESEYSPEAESLYADFVAAGDTGEAAFEALCRRHPEWADELDGLHLDFASVAGVLARMPSRMGTQANGLETQPQQLAEAVEAAPVPESEPSAPPVPEAPTPRASRWLPLALGLLLVSGGAAGLWQMQQAVAERERLQSELDETQSALRAENQRAETADRETRLAADRAERETRGRLQAEQTALELRRQAQAAEERATRIAAAAQAASEWTQVQTLLERGELPAARAALKETSAPSWERRHLERRLETLEAAAQRGRRLVEATFLLLAAERWTPNLAQAVSAGVREAARTLPAADVSVGAHEVLGELQGTQRRFELKGERLRVLEPDLGVPLLVVDIAPSIRGLSFSGGELWLHPESGAPRILP